MHLKAFGDMSDTAEQAGTSSQMIEDHYRNVNIPKEDALGFYRLSPRSFNWRVKN
jgi:hypothetical protein